MTKVLPPAPHSPVSNLDTCWMALPLCNVLHVAREPRSSQHLQREARGQGRGLPLPRSVVDELMQEKEDAGASQEWAAQQSRRSE